ncbi:MAG TPA: GTP cyclohydrolase I FolE [Armatimonadota bacterium]|jgi:GTP cyclohydrolase I
MTDYVMPRGAFLVGEPEDEEERFADELRSFEEERNGQPANALAAAAGADLYRGLIERIGEDPNREGLLKTPDRAYKAFGFLTEGYRQNVQTVLNDAVFHESYDDMVLVRDIEFYSLCEHHLLPFMGKAHVAYLPNGKVIGLSKIARLVNMFSRRLQVQERLTQEIGQALEDAIQPSGVAVVMEAQHMCMMLRGVQKQSSSMMTSYVSGRFREDAKTRSEVMDLLKIRSR